MESEIPGLSVEMLEGGAIVAYTLASAQTTTISAWSDLAISKLKEWPKDRPYLALHDLSYPGVGLLYLTAVEFDPFNVGVTSSGHRAVRELLATNSGWPVILALVVSTSLSGRLTRLRIADIVNNSLDITSRAFFKRSAAVEWLMSFTKPSDKIATGLTDATPQPSVGVTLPVVSATPVSAMDIPSVVTAPIAAVPTSITEVMTPGLDAPDSVNLISDSSREDKSDS